MQSIFSRFILAITLLAFATACNDLTVGPVPANSPEKNFDLLWQEYDRMYGLFEVKSLDWDAVYQKYRPLVKPGMSDDELFDVIASMLDELNDGHVWLLKQGPAYRRHDSGPTYPGDDFSREVAASYVTGKKEISTADGLNVLYGKLPGNIGYVYFVDFGQSPAFYQKAMDEVLSALGDTKGLVVDIRNLGGGEDRSALHIAGRFATERHLYMTTRFRNGPQHTDFSAPYHWYVEPMGKTQYTKPVVLLTNRTTQSAGETFTLAMRQNSQVTHLGDTTYGVFSDNPKRELPNGWIYSISTGDFRAADGKSYEGVGIPPQLLIKNKPEDIKAGADKTLETAVQRLSNE